MKQLSDYIIESLLDLNPESEIEYDIDIFDLILKSKNRHEFNERLDMLESLGEAGSYLGDNLNKKDVYFFVVTNTLGKDVYKHVNIGCNGKAYVMKYYIGKPEISYGEPWRIMLKDNEKLKLPEKMKKHFKKHFR